MTVETMNSYRACRKVVQSMLFLLRFSEPLVFLVLFKIN